MKRFALCLLLAAAVLFPTTLFAAIAGAVRGKVFGPDNKPMAGVVVQLRNDITGFKQDAATTADGTFSMQTIFDQTAMTGSIPPVHSRCSMPLTMTKLTQLAQQSAGALRRL